MCVSHGKHKLCFPVCSGHTIGKPLLLFSFTFPPEMAQKVPAYSICWDKSELQKEYFFARKVMGFAIHSVYNWVTGRVLKLVWVTIFSKILTNDGHNSCIIFLANRTIIGHYFFYQTQFYDWDSSQKQGLGNFMISMQKIEPKWRIEYKKGVF